MRPKERTILLAEDNASDVVFIRMALVKAEIANPVQVVETGEEVIAYLEGRHPYEDRGEHPFPELLLLDLKLPRIDGWEVLRWLRSHENPLRDSVPVVVISGFDRQQDRERAGELGAQFYIVKPVRLRDMVDTVREMRRTPRLRARCELARPRS